MSNLIILKNKNLYVSTNIIAKNCDVEHRSILKLIKTHRKDIEDFGKLIDDIEKIPKGRPLNVFLLNEEQFTFLVTLMQNSNVTVKAKKEITKEFFRMRKTLLNLATQKANQEWIENRSKGKISRLKETDIIKKFIQYAKDQGSKNADKYYITLTNMENKALFLIEQKFKNLREILNINQLDEIKQADEIVLKALDDGMNGNLKYKDIYQLAKKRVELFSSLKGQSVVPSIEFKQIGSK